jgi:hypothetical protein
MDGVGKLKESRLPEVGDYHIIKLHLENCKKEEVI